MSSIHHRLVEFRRIVTKAGREWVPPHEVSPDSAYWRGEIEICLWWNTVIEEEAALGWWDAAFPPKPKPSPIQQALAELKEIVGDEWREPDVAGESLARFGQGPVSRAMLFIDDRGEARLRTLADEAESPLGTLPPGVDLNNPSAIRASWRRQFGEPEVKPAAVVRVNYMGGAGEMVFSGWDLSEPEQSAAELAERYGMVGSVKRCPRCNTVGAVPLDISGWDCPGCGEWLWGECVTDEVVREWAEEQRLLRSHRNSTVALKEYRGNIANRDRVCFSHGREFWHVAFLCLAGTEWLLQYAHPTREGAIQLAWEAHAEEIRREYYKAHK